MAKIPIILKTVNCNDGTVDTFVEVNKNTTNANDKVQAFVDVFRNAANKASTLCYGLPQKVILAQWGGESGWATGALQRNNQNWANIVYTSSTNPVGNVGKGTNGWAKFEGINKFSTGYGKFFVNNSRYSGLITYLKNCQNNNIEPAVNTCIRYIADAGYGGADHDEYYDSFVGWVSTLVNRSDID